MAKIEYYTPDRVSVTRRIEKGQTVVFTAREPAINHANNIRSYVYDLYISQNRKTEFFGWAVPF